MKRNIYIFKPKEYQLCIVITRTHTLLTNFIVCYFSEIFCLVAKCPYFIALQFKLFLLFKYTKLFHTYLFEKIENLTFHSDGIRPECDVQNCKIAQIMYRVPSKHL